MREADDVQEGYLRYLNRLSDYFFVVSRWAANAHGEPEDFWEHPDKSAVDDARGVSG